MNDGRLNLTLPKAINSRLEKYCVEIAKKEGRIPHALKTRIARKAIQEWLDRNEKNFDIKTLLKNKG